MDSATRELVRSRVGLRCEYYRLAQRHTKLTHHLEHIVAKHTAAQTKAGWSDGIQ